MHSISGRCGSSLPTRCSSPSASSTSCTRYSPFYLTLSSISDYILSLQIIFADPMFFTLGFNYELQAELLYQRGLLQEHMQVSSVCVLYFYLLGAQARGPIRFNIC